MSLFGKEDSKHYLVQKPEKETSTQPALGQPSTPKKMKRLIICADGTWNQPETDIDGTGDDRDYPTNVLRLARGIAPHTSDGLKQIVFYDWGVGTDNHKVSGAIAGNGLEKNVMDCYRFIVHNYDDGDEIILFGFSRGAYTVRCLAGMLNNCHILKSSEASLIPKAFELYKDTSAPPKSEKATKWRTANSIPNSGKVHFIGVWDTVGSLGLPFTFFGLLKRKDLFYDSWIGSNIEIARHALSLDEKRDDFEATVWNKEKDQQEGYDPSEYNLKQVWFAGTHTDVGGGYPPDKEDNTHLSDIPMMWMLKEAQKEINLELDAFLPVKKEKQNPLAKQHDSLTGIFALLGSRIRTMESTHKVHASVIERLQNDSNYECVPIENYKAKYGADPEIEPWN